MKQRLLMVAIGVLLAVAVFFSLVLLAEPTPLSVLSQ